MCGISGYIGKQKLTEKQISDTLGKMYQRGPDIQSYKEFVFDDLVVYLFHARLSILDLNDRSNQPYTIGDYVMIYNGEIYNYIELRSLLQKKGIVFSTDSDTEVLLQMYIHYKEKCVDFLEGMWSFAIFNKGTKELFCSRDRFGEKPFYFFEQEHGFYFGSQTSFIKTLTGFKLEINYNQLNRYLVNGYKSLYKQNETYYKNVFELPVASNLTLSKNNKIRLDSYYTPIFQPVQMSLGEAINGTRERLIESMRLRLRSDVPLAFCLSGGVDSAALASIASKEFNHNVTSFSIIDPDERYNELPNIQATIDDIGCYSEKIELKPHNMLDRLNNLIAYHDAPVATISYLVHSMLSEKIQEKGFKVSFSGTGADELYTGYYDHFNQYLFEQRNSSLYTKYLNDWKENAGKIVRNPYMSNPEMYFQNSKFRDHIYLNNDVFSSYTIHGFKEQFVETNYCSESLLRNRMLNELFHEGTRVILNQDDLNSMQHSIENRSPFLDRKLFEFAYSIPNEYLIQDGYGKYILRESMKGILNDQVRLDKHKKGFNASINSVIDTSNLNDVDFILEDSEVYHLVDRNKVIEILKQPTLSNSFSKFLFNFINVKLFLDQRNS
jgi:asparagine synthase (glutamine-hydrolysing)